MCASPETTLITRPRDSRSAGSAAEVTRQGPRRLTSITASASASGASPALCGVPSPALLISTSSPPSRPIGLRDGGVDRGLVAHVAREHRLAVALEVEADTVAPRARSAFVAAVPIPPRAPVTRTRALMPPTASADVARSGRERELPGLERPRAARGSARSSRARSSGCGPSRPGTRTCSRSTTPCPPSAGRSRPSNAACASRPDLDDAVARRRAARRARTRAATPSCRRPRSARAPCSARAGRRGSGSRSSRCRGRPSGCPARRRRAGTPPRPRTHSPTGMSATWKPVP